MRPLALALLVAFSAPAALGQGFLRPQKNRTQEQTLKAHAERIRKLSIQQKFFTIRSMRLLGSPQVALGGVAIQDSLRVSVPVVRASSSSCIGADGVTMSTVGTNTACVENEGLRLDEGSTNLLLRSGELDQSPWASGATGAVAPTVTADVATAPLASGSAAEQLDFPAVSGGNFSLRYQSFTATAVKHSFSAWVKAVGTDCTTYLSMTNGGQWFSRACDAVTTGYKFCWVNTGQFGGALTVATWYMQLGVDLRDSAQSAKPACSVLVADTQVEAKLATTAYIPTAGTQATRAITNYFVTKPLWLGLEGCTRYCLTPNFQGSPNFGGYPMGGILGYHNNDTGLNTYNGSTVTTVVMGQTVSGPTFKGKACYRVDWNTSGRTLTNVNVGSSSSAAAYPVGYFGNPSTQFTAGWGQFNGWVSDIAFFSKPGSCL